MEKENTKVVAVRLPADVVASYERMAEKVNMTRNKFLSVLLRVGYVIVEGCENDPEGTNEILEGVFDDVSESVKPHASI